MGSFNCSLRFRSNFKFAIQWQFLKRVCLLCITSACHYNEPVKSHIHNNYRLLDVFICCFPLSQPLLILILLNHRHTCKDAYLQSFFPMGLSVFFFLKHSVSNAGKIHLFLNRHAFGVCHTLSSCSQTESNRRALKYSVLFCHIFFCYPMFYSNTTGSQLIFSSQTTKDG